MTLYVQSQTVRAATVVHQIRERPGARDLDCRLRFGISSTPNVPLTPLTPIQQTRLMSIAMTEQQEREFDENGFIILEEFLHVDELDRLLAAVDEVAVRVRRERNIEADGKFSIRNLLSHHAAFLDLVDHSRMLPLVVDAMGWNLQVRTSHLDYRPPYPEGVEAGEVGTGEGSNAGYNNVSWHPDLAGDYLFEAPSLDGRLPFMESKVFYALSDLSGSNRGNLWVVPGSHKRSPQELRDSGGRVDPREAVELKLSPGAAVLWRTATWHCVGPNTSELTRKIIHIGYHYRWLRPTDYITQDQQLLDGCSPIRRQLLGGLAPDVDPLGDDAEFTPSSNHWIVRNSDDVPLRQWAEEQSGFVQAKEPL